MYSPLCGSGWTMCILVLPRDVPIPQVAQAGLEGLGCIRSCVGVARPCVSSFSHEASVSPKRPKHDRRDSAVSTAVWDCVDLVYPCSPTGQPYSPSGPRRTGGNGLHPLLCGSGWAHAYLPFRRGLPIPKAAHAGPEELECIHCCVGMAGPCAYFVFPRGVPIPQAAQAGPGGLECIRRCVAVAGPCVSSLSPGVSLSPTRPR